MAAWLGKRASWRYLVIHQMLKTQPKLHRKPKSLMKCSTRFAIGKDESSWHVWQVIYNGSTILNAADRSGRKVVLTGQDFERIIRTAMKLEKLQLPSEDLLVKPKEMKNMHPNSY